MASLEGYWNQFALKPPSATKDSFMYDSAGHRVKRTTGGVVTWYIYDGDTMIAQKSETGYTEYEIPGVGWVSPTGSGYTTTYALTNQRGDTVGLAIGNQLTNIRDYDAYGGFYTLLANSDSDHRYVGSKGVIWNNASQTYTMGLREYSPYLGRFLNQDPIGYKGGINLYAYCGNEPVMKIDTSGRRPEKSNNYWGQVGGVFIGYGQAIKGVFASPWIIAETLGYWSEAPDKVGFGLHLGKGILDSFTYGLSGERGAEGFGEAFGNVLIIASSYGVGSIEGGIFSNAKYVTHWDTPARIAAMTESGIMEAGLWVQRGKGGLPGYFFSGAVFRYSFTSKITLKVPKGALNGTPGIEFFKTAFGQRTLAENFSYRF